MYGIGDKFVYFQCSECGCLQLADIPNDLHRYYPGDYYSFQLPGWLNHNSLRKRINLRLTYLLAMHSNCPDNPLFSKVYCPPNLFRFDWIEGTKVNRNSRILDIGCGAGDILVEMANYGFKHLLGADPYIENDLIYDNGVRIRKLQLDEIDQQFDFIMLNHSFEHMDNPLLALKNINRLLRPGKYCLVRVPVASSYAWKHYGVNWFQIDAPRHLYLYTPKSMEILAAQSGFSVKHTTYDSTLQQFILSEQYAKGITLHDAKSYAKDPRNSLIGDDELAAYEAKVKELNAIGEGDQACFYLCKNQ